MSAYAARIRAARAYAGLSQKELAGELGVDEQTIKRRERGTQEPKRAERLAIAHVCEVPPEFLELGFGTITASEIDERLARIEDALGEARSDALGLLAQALADLGLVPGTSPEARQEGADDQDHPDEAAGGAGA